VYLRRLWSGIARSGSTLLEMDKGDEGSSVADIIFSSIRHRSDGRCAWIDENEIDENPAVYNQARPTEFCWELHFRAYRYQGDRIQGRSNMTEYDSADMVQRMNLRNSPCFYLSHLRD
jgi:hypothetical protein